MVDNSSAVLQKSTEERLLKILNSGELKEIKSLKSIGAVRAQQILSLRAMIGSFSSISDLTPILSQKAIQNFCALNIQVDFLKK